MSITDRLRVWIANRLTVTALRMVALAERLMRPVVRRNDDLRAMLQEMRV